MNSSVITMYNMVAGMYVDDACISFCINFTTSEGHGMIFGFGCVDRKYQVFRDHSMPRDHGDWTG